MKTKNVDSPQAVAGQVYCRVRPLVERLRSKAWEDRHHRKYREEAAARIEALEMELSEVLTWAKVEKAPLRQQEIDSIRRVLAA
jgi:hypothetical protein